MQLTLDDLLHLLSFLFTIILILLAIIKGLGDIELTINVLYFATLNITFIRYLLSQRNR